jgi:hypothetical protein
MKFESPFYIKFGVQAMSELSLLVARFSPQKSEFNLMIINVEFIVDKAAEKSVFLRAVLFSTANYLSTQLSPGMGTMEPFHAEIPRDWVSSHSYN